MSDYITNPKPIAGVQPIDISMEDSRTYIYADGERVNITMPRVLHVMPNGSHRVIDASGLVYRPSPGYLAIYWVPRGNVPFVA